MDDKKTKILREQGVLNPQPEKVKDSLFQEKDLFDPRDLVQVKYEMIRRVQTDKLPVARAAETFGFSRPSFYKARQAFEKEGIAGLVPKKRGPKGRHKLTDEILISIEEMLATEPGLPSKEIIRRLQNQFGLTLHQRTIERALAEKKKKLVHKPTGQQSPV